MDALKPLVRRAGYSTPLQNELKKHLGKVHAFKAVQVGAHDGITHDPFREYLIRPGWKSVVVEPNPAVYQLLRRNYSAYRNVIPVNAAVSYATKELTLWTFEQQFLAGRPDGSVLSTLVSFSPENMRKFVAPDDPALNHLKSFTVQCFTLEELAERHGLPQVDGIFVDVEGYENQILLHTDYARLKPSLVVFENHLL